MTAGTLVLAMQSHPSGLDAGGIEDACRRLATGLWDGTSRLDEWRIAWPSIVSDDPELPEIRLNTPADGGPIGDDLAEAMRSAFANCSVVLGRIPSQDARSEALPHLARAVAYGGVDPSPTGIHRILVRHPTPWCPGAIETIDARGGTIAVHPTPEGMTPRATGLVTDTEQGTTWLLHPHSAMWQAGDIPDPVTILRILSSDRERT